MKIIVIISLYMLIGCTPFIEGGLGYSAPAGFVVLDETGTVGYYGIGIEFHNEQWYTPSECGYYHRSMVNKQPEIAINDFICKKRIRFGSKK